MVRRHTDDAYIMLTCGVEHILRSHRALVMVRLDALCTHQVYDFMNLPINSASYKFYQVGRANLYNLFILMNIMIPFNKRLFYSRKKRQNKSN